jgi:threonine dehydrogenase-like Zn-dependent dehydrogenase
MKGKVAIMTEPMKLIFKEYDIPKPEKNAVILEITRTNICGSELHIWKGHHPAKKSGVMGHEATGKIYELGEEVKTDYEGNPLEVGDRVAFTYFLTCRKCASCQQGQFHLCENAYLYWSKDPEEAPHFHGTFGTHYYMHPDQYFYKVPDNVPDIVAASANCALSQVYFGLERANLRYGETLVVQGAGGLGLNACAVAKEFGATVIVIDGFENRLQLAKEFGADYTINFHEYENVGEHVVKLTKGGADVGLEVTGVPSAFQEGIQLIRPGGRYVSIGNVSPGFQTNFDPGLLTRKAITIYPVVRYEPWYLNKSLQFLSRNIDRYPFYKMFDSTYSLEEISVALDKSAKREVTRASIVINSKSTSNHHNAM